MSTIIKIHRKIRRAVQIPLYNAAIAANLVNEDDEPLIKWGALPYKHERDGMPLTPEGQPLPNYLAVTINYSDVIVRTMGKKPIVEGPGNVAINIHSPRDHGEDGNDALLGIIEAAYPYDFAASFEGIEVNIDKTSPRGYGVDGPWVTGLYIVNWNIYRRDD